MRALVVYESMYGNTQHVAQAIADGLGEATVVEVVGGPTHAHGMSHDRSRHDAAARVDRPVVSPTIGIREWLERLEAGPDVVVATFDTRIDMPAILTGSAAKSAAGVLRHRRARLVGTASFVLDGATGEPFDRVAPAELERARAWGRTLAEHLPVTIG
jgi:hypothetical protein